MPELTYSEHASLSRQSARARGLSDAIHFAPQWRERSDALYATANESGLPWWDGVVIGLLADGRMAVTSNVVSFFEPHAGA